MLSQILAVLTIAAVIGPVQAAERGGTRFWNLTGETITHLSMAPAGTAQMGSRSVPQRSGRHCGFR